MSLGDLTRVVERATTDFAFLAELNEKPDQALAGYDLSSEERAALLKGDPSDLHLLGVDSRITMGVTNN